MNVLRTSLVAVALSGIIVSGIALAQTSATSPTASPTGSTSEPSVATKVESWSRKKWEAMRREWARDKQKWADCQKQAADEKLTGRKSWSFLYHCMT
jgi:hypothetical protein